ncbi:hypothetical protein P4B35_15090 [Pontiellaceae bacterium B12227]|nr:hypothetical protein [Pontiellaceae bacterium B12227]
MKIKIRTTTSREYRWDQSRREEQRGNYAKAFKIHETILAEDAGSYAACLRAGWLCYRMEAYEKALHFYEDAAAQSNEDWPLHGIMNCLEALGKTEAADQVAATLGGVARVPAAIPA